MKRKTILSDYIDYEFTLIGICSEDEDFKLCWKLNNLLAFDFSRQSDLEITLKPSKIQARFSVFKHADEDTGLDYYLITNRNTQGTLLSELNKIDYLLKITGEQDWVDSDEIIRKIRTIPSVKTTFSIDPLQLSKGENIIF